MSSADRRRHPRTAPAGSDVALLVTERLVAHGQILDVSPGGARVLLARGTPATVVAAMREAAAGGYRVDLVDDGAAGPRRARIAWFGALPDGEFALGIELEPDAEPPLPPRRTMRTERPAASRG